MLKTTQNKTPDKLFRECFYKNIYSKHIADGLQVKEIVE
jgi:hypothetical protein